MKPARVLISFLLLVVACAQAQKEVQLPKDLPPYGAIAPLAAPEVKTLQLENGLTVWLVPRPGFPKVAVNLAVRGGRAADPSDRPGLAELLANALTQGTGTRSARQIAEEFQAAGGDLSASAGEDSISVRTNVLAEKLDQVLPVLADVAANASFPDSEVEIARRNLINSLRSREADPSFLAQRALARAMYGSHPYSVIAPTEASLQQTTAAELRREFARRFQPKQSLLVVAGAFDPGKAETALRKTFQSWKPAQSDSVSETSKPVPVAPHGVILVPRAGSVQTTFLLGAPGPLRRDPDYAATQIANAIYGGMFGSRLVRNIREDKGYTYSPGASLSTYRAAGNLETQADVRNAVTGATLNEINYELNRMTTTSPNETEMTQAKRSIVGIEAIILQSNGRLARQFAGLWVEDLPPGEISHHSEMIGKATAADVTAAARKYFPAARATIVTVGEEDVVKKELAPFGVEIKPAQ